MKVVVVDYDMGNLHSVAQAIRVADPCVEVILTQEAKIIKTADRIILPGQGAMPDCMRKLSELEIRETLLEAIHQKPTLGICIGEQMLFDESEEGQTPALGILPGKVKHLNLDHLIQGNGARFKIPHIGWNQVEQCIDHPIWENIPNHAYFYFVHSYYAEPIKVCHLAAKSCYGISFACAVAAENIFAVQFHPEKSAQVGIQLFKNFICWRP